MSEESEIQEQPQSSAYMRLRGRHRRFVDAYITNGGEASKAIMEIGFRGRRPDQAAWRVRQHPDVQAAIAERMEWAIKVRGDRILRYLDHLDAIATFDSRELLDDDGNARPTHAWPDSVAAAIQGLDVEALLDGSGKDRTRIGNVLKYRAYNKTEAIKLLLQFHGKLSERHEHTGANGAPLAPPVINIGFDNGGPGD